MCIIRAHITSWLYKDFGGLFTVYIYSIRHNLFIQEMNVCIYTGTPPYNLTCSWFTILIIRENKHFRYTKLYSPFFPNNKKH